ncbi:hypothetical protein DV515_00006223 [Chloebia gouldiae]|uniref:Uncharacterized protein n=1 Tax=Chloebia gouldiae TaxID=44316 RepID=A0A3L8SKQ2_CHLGU|nr:hypothetical protein DV515_00006223 [Chloebia gouldiae]
MEFYSQQEIPGGSHHHPQWHLEKLWVPENLWKGKIRSPRAIIRFTKVGSVLLGGVDWAHPFLKCHKKWGK